MTSEMGKAADATIGEDLKSARIELYGLNQRPDLLPETISYFGLYRATTPLRVLFFRTSHKIREGSENDIDVNIGVYPFDKEGDLQYSDQPSSQFSAAELDYIRDLIAKYLRTDRSALHPIYRGKQVKDITIRFG